MLTQIHVIQIFPLSFVLWDMALRASDLQSVFPAIFIPTLLKGVTRVKRANTGISKKKNATHVILKNALFIPNYIYNIKLIGLKDPIRSYLLCTQFSIEDGHLFLIVVPELYVVLHSNVRCSLEETFKWNATASGLVHSLVFWLPNHGWPPFFSPVDVP